METRKIIQNCLNYIENNLKAEITIDEICNIAGYSRIHLDRLFQSYIGISVKEYINRRKLLYAVYDMFNDQRKIDVALTYGLETYSGFYKAFKNEFNCSPTKFIKFYSGSKPYKINIFQEEHIMISKNRIRKLLIEWGIQDKPISNIYNANTNTQNENAYYIGDNFILKFSANFGYIKKNIDLSEMLKKENITTFEIIKTLNNKMYVKQGELYFIVTKRIKGKQIKCEEIFDDCNLAITIGQNIAKLHKTLKNFDEYGYENVNIYETTIENFDQTEILNKKFISEYKNNFGSLFDKLPKQLIHRDINPSNMIFDNDEFTGFIDFDLCEVNIRIFDICYCATSILSECFTNSKINKNKWFEIVNKILSGYEKIIELNKEEKIAIPYVINSIQIICITYFGKFEKYNYLKEVNINILNWILNNNELFI